MIELKTRVSAAGMDGTDLLVLPIFEGEEVYTHGLGHSSHSLLTLAASGQLRTALYEPTLLRSQSEEPTILLVGAGERPALDLVALTRLAEAASRYATSRGFSSLTFILPELEQPANAARAVVQGIVRGAYNPGIRKTRATHRSSISQITLIVGEHAPDDMQAAIREAEIVGDCANMARELVNLPPNELTPISFAERVKESGNDVPLQVEVLDEREMSNLGMGGILGVAAGSRQPPRLIVLRYGDPDADVKLAIVGKGITFDSGGLSIKTAEGMETMKGDMGGGAAVFGGMLALARLLPPNISVTGYIGATENMPGDNAMRPGDILTAFSGETIEVLNTDAEGRLVLADVLAYAERCGATHIVDFATLTGGAIVTLGAAASLGSGKPHSWVQEVAEAANDGFERIWPMPLYPEYRASMNSEFADIKNSGGRGASALTATAFLADFVGDVPWAHIDIAGTSFVSEPRAYTANGGTGVGVATIVALVDRLSRGVHQAGEKEKA